MANTHFSGPVVQGTDARPAAATNVFSSRTVISAAASVEGALAVAGALSVTGAFDPGSGFVFEAGDSKLLAMGTYIGTGGATAAIVSTGLTAIGAVFLNKNSTEYNTATTGLTIPKPCVAAGTSGSFYPTMYKLSQGAANWALNDVSGTFRWFAIGT